MKNKFLEEILTFTPEVLGGKTSDEIIRLGLDVYKKLPGYRSASLFFINKIDFDFYFKAASTPDYEEEIKKVFLMMIDKGIVANALSKLEIAVLSHSTFNGEPASFIVIPLIIQTAVVGLNLLIMSAPFKNKELYTDLCKLHARYFALLLNSKEQTNCGNSQNRIRLDEKFVRLQESDIKLAYSDKFKSYLLLNLRNEFKAPLENINEYGRLIKENLINSGEKEETGNDLYASSLRMLNTLDSVLRISLLESGEIPVNLVITDIAELILLKSKRYIECAGGKKLHFNIEFDANDFAARVDKELFSLIVDHLIFNAFKFTDEGSVRIIIGKSSEDGKHWIIVKILDTGCGIDPKPRESCPKAFIHNGNELMHRFDGCGLGLTITEKMIELMDGHLTLESELSKGSEFTIWLPKPVPA